MTDLIDREKVIEAIDDISVEVDEGYGFQYEKWRKYFCELPSVPRKGKWIKDTKRFGDDNYHCSVCSAVLEEDDVKWRNNYFCYHCGSDNRGE